MQASNLFLQQLSIAIRDEQTGVNESIHTISETRFSFAVQFVARLIHAFIPTGIGKLVNL